MATILVIEEDPQLLRLWCQVLETAGYRVYAARDLAEGLTHGQQHGIDLVIIAVPGAEQEHLATVQALRTAMASVKLLVLVGGSRRGAPERRQRFLQGGAHRALSKPIGRGEVLAAVQHLLAGSSVQPPAPESSARQPCPCATGSLGAAHQPCGAHGAGVRMRPVPTLRGDGRVSPGREAGNDWRS
jgi:DNA-binding response OmpR family regulator